MTRYLFVLACACAPKHLPGAPFERGAATCAWYDGNSREVVRHTRECHVCVDSDCLRPYETRPVDLSGRGPGDVVAIMLKQPLVPLENPAARWRIAATARVGPSGLTMVDTAGRTPWGDARWIVLDLQGRLPLGGETPIDLGGQPCGAVFDIWWALGPDPLNFTQVLSADAACDLGPDAEAGATRNVVAFQVPGPGVYHIKANPQRYEPLTIESIRVEPTDLYVVVAATAFAPALPVESL